MILVPRRPAGAAIRGEQIDIDRSSALLPSFILAISMVAQCAVGKDARAENINEVYEQGVRAYYRGDFNRSIELLERLVAIPVHHEDIFFSLGCSYFRAGLLGPSIFNFERALSLDPRLEDAQYNLEIARDRVRSRVKDVFVGAFQMSVLDRVVGFFSIERWSTLTIALFWLAIATSLAARTLKPGVPRAAVIALASTICVCFVVVFLIFSAGIHGNLRIREAIVLPDQLVVLEGPDQQARKSFELHAGSKVTVRSQTKEWLKIQLDNGLQGWVSRHELGMIQR